MNSQLSAVTWRDVAKLMWCERVPVLIALACALVGPIAAMAVPFASKLVIDDVIGRGRNELLMPVTIGLLAAIAIQGSAVFCASWAGAIAGHRAVTRIRERLQRHAFLLPVSFFDTTPTGAIVSHVVADAEQVRHLFGAGMLQLISGGATAVLAFAMLASFNLPLTTVVLAVLGSMALCLSRGYFRLHHAFCEVNRAHTTLAGRLTERLANVRVIKAYAAERREAHRFSCDAHAVHRASLRVSIGVSTIRGVTALVNGGLSLLLLVLGAQAVASGTMTLGELALFVILVGLLSTPVVQLAAIAGEIGRALAALARINEVLAIPTETARDSRNLAVPSLTGAIACDGVSYAYVAHRPVLRNVSLSAHEGSFTALVGPNGAGKSTLLALLMGFDEPTSGRILVDGKPLAGLRRRELRRHYGVVLQTADLLDGTIAENVRYGRPHATTSEFRRAARLSHCDEFVARLPDGYETVVGERGVRLSGGERQRVAIARALLADPRVLILDEATTHLDTESEMLIEDALRALCRGRTTFAATHRLSTVRSADQILVLDGGEVIERGAHEGLLMSKGSYWSLCQQQNGALHARTGLIAGLRLADDRKAPRMTVGCRKSPHSNSR